MTRYVTRKEWGAVSPNNPGGNYISGPVSMVVCHHTPNMEGESHVEVESEDDAFYWVKEIQRQHMNQGWADIGYTFLLSGDIMFEGRGYNRTGAHAPGANSTSVGLAFLLDARDRAPTALEWHTAGTLIHKNIEDGWLTPNFTISGHRDHVATQCPGEKIYSLIPDRAFQALAEVDSGVPAPPILKETMAYTANRTDYVGLGVDGNIYHKIFSYGEPKWIPDGVGWTPIGAPPGLAKDDVNVTWANDWLVITTLSKKDSSVWHKRYHPSHGWIEWERVGDLLATKVATATRYVT